MYRMPNAKGTVKPGDASEEKKLSRQNIWRSVYFFVGYVLTLRLGK